MDIKNVFTKKECQSIVRDFEKNKEHIAVSTDHGVERISSYEIDIKYLSNDIKKLIDKKIEKNILSRTGGGKTGMVFGVKYSMNTKTYMDAHYDCNTYSCVITLNDDFGGGGTYFPLTGIIKKPKVGNGYMFKANTIKSYHEAYPITNGVRYVLVVRTEKRGALIQLLDSLFLHFVDIFIRKFKSRFYKKPI